MKNVPHVDNNDVNEAKAPPNENSDVADGGVNYDGDDGEDAKQFATPSSNKLNGSDETDLDVY